MNILLNNLKDLINKHPLFENGIIFNGVDNPYFDVQSCKSIYFCELQKRINSKIQEINTLIEITQEEKNDELSERLIRHRRKIRSLLNTDLCNVKSIEDLQFPNELLIDHSQFGVE